MTSTEIRTPTARSAPRIVDLGGGTKLWRKQVLPLDGEINYAGGKLKFDKAYLDEVARAYHEHAFDTVPFVLAPDNNDHTMAAERGRYGEALGFDVDLDAVDEDTGLPAPGLYTNIKLGQEALDIVDANKRFGVSLRLKEHYERPDGRYWPVACQHVLGTWDPRVTGMSGWRAVDLANSTDGATSTATAVIDLSGLAFETETSSREDQMPTAAPTKQSNDDLVEAFRRFLETQGGAPASAEDASAADTSDPNDTAAVVDTDDALVFVDDQGNEMSDEAFNAWAAGVLDGDPGEGDEDGYDGEGQEADQSEGSEGSEGDAGGEDAAGAADTSATTETSQPRAGGDVELSQTAYADQRYRDLELSNRTMRAELDSANYERERERIVKATGVPPHIVDLARPLLEGSGRTVALSNGRGEADAGAIARQLLSEFGKTVRLLDLSSPTGGHLLTYTDDEKAQAEARSARGSEIAKTLNLV